MTEKKTEIEQIKDAVGIIKESYDKSAEAIQMAYGAEASLRDDYRGRQIDELLQNADDCHIGDDKSVLVKFELDGNRLIVKNTGLPFTAEGVKSLMYPYASPKHEGTIGCKGLGFRSVLNWADEIDIHTKAFHVNFSEKRARKALDEYREKHADNESYTNKLKTIDRLPILSTPEASDDKDMSAGLLGDYSTAIVLCCKEEYIGEIDRQLENLRFEELLFLKHIKEISIKTPESQRTITADERAENNRMRISIRDSSNPETQEWLLWSKNGEVPTKDGEKTYELALAYNLNEEEREKTRKNGRLYSYFRTDIHMPFPFLAHGTFELTSERNHLLKGSESNEKIAEELAGFIAETAERIAEESGVCDYAALGFLLPSERIDFMDDEYGFTTMLKEKIRESRIFPSVNEEYLSLSDKPRYTDKRFDMYVNKKTFSLLLKHTDDGVIRNYLRETGIGFYNADTVSALIDADADEYVERGVHTDLLYLLNDTYSYLPDPPKLIVGSDGVRITDPDVTVFTNPETEEITELPGWSSMRFMDKRMEKTLRDKWNCTAGTLAVKLSEYGCEEYRFGAVMSELVRQSGDDAGRVRDMLIWTFKFREKGGVKDSMLPGNIRIVSRDGTVVKAGECYIGAEYGCEVGERLTSELGGAVYAASKEGLGMDGYEADRVKEFLKALGASEFPRIKPRSLSKAECCEYGRYNKTRFTTLSTGYETFSSWEVFHWGFPNENEGITVSDIEDLDRILDCVDPADIIFWLLEDDRLRKAVESETEVDLTSKMTFKPPHKQYTREVRKDCMRSWLRKRVTCARWLPTMSGNRADPAHCTMRDYGLTPVLECVCIDYEKLEKMTATAGRPVKKNEIRLTLEKLGVVEDLSDLPEDTIYETLLGLPSCGISDVKTVKRAYTAIIQAFSDDASPRSCLHDEFTKRGEVLAKQYGEYGYHPVSEVYYVERKRYSEDILGNIPVIPLNRRSGGKRIQSIFGINLLGSLGDIDVTYEENALNKDFQEEYGRILPYIYAKQYDSDRKSGEKLRKLKRTGVVLVREATTRFEIGGAEREGRLSDYEMIYNDGRTGDGDGRRGEATVYIKIPDTIRDIASLKSDTSFQCSLSEAITTMLDVDENADAYSLFIGKTAEQNEEYYRCIGETDTLRDAQEAWGMHIDPKETFWEAVSEASGMSRETLMEKYSAFLPDGFDFRNVGKDGDAEAVIALFRELNIDVKDYNAEAYHRISIKEHNINSFRELKKEYRDRYLSWLAGALAGQKKHKGDFDRGRDKFDFAEPADCDSVLFDAEKTFTGLFRVTTADLDGESEDYESLLRNLPDEPEAPHAEGEHTGDGRENPGRADAPDYVDIYKSMSSTNRSPAQPVETGNDEPAGRDRDPVGGKHGARHASESAAAKDTNGYTAECEVYLTLLKWQEKKKINAVRWVSENAEKAGKAPDGCGDDSLGYDMEYKDADGKSHYVEVKSTSSDDVEFMMSRNEFDFATNEEHKEVYDLWFVSMKDGKPQKTEILGPIFALDKGETPFSNSRYTIETGEYRIRAKRRGGAASDNQPNRMG